eukprot:SAG31_NODE_6591_length_1959_cov_3.953226_1_plen_432_part_10
MHRTGQLSVLPVAALLFTCAPPLVFGTTNGFKMTYGYRLSVILFRLPCESIIRPESPDPARAPNPTDCRRINISSSSSFSSPCRLPRLYRRGTYRSDDENLVFNFSHLNRDSHTNVEMNSSLASPFSKFDFCYFESCSAVSHTNVEVNSSLASPFSKFEPEISYLRHISCLGHQTMISSNVVNFGLALSMPGLALDSASTYDYVIFDETTTASVEYYPEFQYGFNHAPDSRAVHSHDNDFSNSRLVVLISEQQSSHGGIFFHNFGPCFAELDPQFQYNQDSSDFSSLATLHCFEMEFTYSFGIFNNLQSSSAACNLAWQYGLTCSCFYVAAVLCIYQGNSYDDAIFFDYLNLFWIKNVTGFQYDAVALSLVMLACDMRFQYEADIVYYFESCSAVSEPRLPYNLDSSILPSSLGRLTALTTLDLCESMPYCY